MTHLEFTTDPFGGVSTATEALPHSVADFTLQLQDSLNYWASNNYRLVWLKVPIEKAAFVPVAVAAGFVFHHAEAGYVMLTRQLVAGAFVPGNASHTIGAGAVVINQSRQLLVVVEKYHAKDRPNFYKMPGGMLNPGEHLVEGAMREVYEETGIRTRFESVACFRHQHGGLHGKSNIYFVCRLSPLNEEIVIDPDEIAEARWMPVEDYLSADHIHVFNKHIVRTAIDCKGSLPVVIEGYKADPALMEIFSA
jgi:8-oxo-dGTP pyrophosphatase MutT (NUDIX family)